MVKYVTDITKRLSLAGQGSYKDDNTKEFIELVCRHSYPTPLRIEMKKAIKYNKSLEKDKNKFLEKLIIEAKRLTKLHHIAEQHRLENERVTKMVHPLTQVKSRIKSQEKVLYVGTLHAQEKKASLSF